MPATPGHDALDGRWIALEGCYNFRDLGGYETRKGRRVRQGVLFRSAGLQQLTGADVARIRDELGVRCVVDLRSEAEVDGDGVGPLVAPPIERAHIPIFDSERREGQPELPEDLGELYFAMIRYARRRIARVLEHLAALDAPAVFHCAAGKARTGVVGAVILGLLGVDDPIILDDDAFTARNLDRIAERLRTSKGYEHVVLHLPVETLHAEPGTMASLLGRMSEHYGTMRDYALAAGVAESSIDRLVERLLE